MKREERSNQGSGGGRDRDGSGGGEKRSFQRRRGCRFCTEPGLLIDFKDRYLLLNFVTERFKIVPRRISGTCSMHQRRLGASIKQARHIAIIPYTTSQV